jgi:hypothetical protein
MPSEPARPASLVAVLALLALPNLAWAHGEQILILLFWNGLALLAAPVLAWKMVRGWWRVPVFLGTPVAGWLSWQLLSSDLGRWPMRSDSGLLLAGILPAAGSVLVALLLRRLHPPCRPRTRPF